MLYEVITDRTKKTYHRLMPFASSRITSYNVCYTKLLRNDITATLKLLESIAKTVSKDQIIVSTSCSLLHTPFTLKYEEKLDSEIKNWLSYAVEKLSEISLISKIFFEGENSLDGHEKNALENNKTANESRRTSSLIHDHNVQNRVDHFTQLCREGSYEERIKIQKDILGYQELATTTIGSFPQTPEVRNRITSYNVCYTKLLRERK